jgi:6-phosphogluconolactonase
VDERCVEPDAEASNYAMAARTFLDKVEIPVENVHRVSGEADDYAKAVAEYEETIRKVFGISKGEFPSFDLMILGMGDDGHIGSLFPNSFAHFDTQDIVTAVYLMSGDFNRITLTHPVICAAKKLFVLVSGEKKASILKEVFEAEPDEVKYPVHSLWPILDKVDWIIDSDAGKLLRDV